MVFYDLSQKLFDFLFWFSIYEATNFIFFRNIFLVCPSILLSSFLFISWILLALQLAFKQTFTGIFWTLLFFDVQYFILIG